MTSKLDYLKKYASGGEQGANSDYLRRFRVARLHALKNVTTGSFKARWPHSCTISLVDQADTEISTSAYSLVKCLL